MQYAELAGLNAEIAETVNLEAKGVWLSRIHFSDEPQRKRSKIMSYIFTQKNAEKSTSNEDTSEIQKFT